MENTEENPGTQAKPVPSTRGNRTIVKIALGLLVLLFVLSFSAFVLVQSVEATLLDANTVFLALQDTGVIKEAYDSLDSSLSQGLPPQLIAEIKKEFPLSRLESIVKTTMTDFLDYLKGKRQDIPKVAIPAFGPIPTTNLDLTVFIPQKSFETARSVVSTISLYKWIVLGISIILLVLIFLIAKPFLTKLKWLSAALIIPGILLGIMSFIISGLPDAILKSMEKQIPKEVSQQMSPLLGKFLGKIASAISFQVLLFAIALIILGIIVVIAFFVMKKKQQA